MIKDTALSVPVASRLKVGYMRNTIRVYSGWTK
jgi:hypothetical protein